MDDPVCPECGYDGGGVVLGALLAMAPLAIAETAKQILIHLAAVAVVVGLVAGAVYTVAVYAAGGHVGLAWRGRAVWLDEWRIRWLGRVFVGFLVGLATAALVGGRSVGVVFACGAALVAGTVAVGICLGGGQGLGLVRWAPAVATTMLLCLAATNRGLNLPLRAFQGSTLLVAVIIALWLAGALLLSLEVRAVAVAVRRGGALLPAG